MKDVLIIGASGGIGSALVQAHQARGDRVVGLSRSGDGFDVTDPDSVAHHLGRLAGPFDQVIVASGALEIGGAAPEKTIRAVRKDAMMDQFALNAVGPALVLAQAHRLLRKDRRAVFAILSARVGSIGDNSLGGWISYRSAKAAVNQIVHTAAIELSRSHPQSICVALHPGTVATPFTQAYLGRHPAVPAEEAAQNLIGVMDGLTPAQTGGFFDWAGSEVPW
ncbi:SDR family NAD(P)-dependent oxidoreductase [Sulfitobacter mediterraneus]|uniref:NAD(P)-dependent dehydrogenase (Short-subunit alcohol dehydrogenase family) n=1 Tax=Sulfitobacter mediterraneus TaxID=83219 RepID=A0A2T6CE43_9RHOB|nr:SDR family NAD(P)-dependent oxidoreductase [Sulfitobacter mediterraneus]KIN75892.1 C factor, cell signaling protein [Sulfitobacter mediterraneus KCTC 32188]PTX73779.1 NAD(P)-dependent dehydrogenase (short-subunit alcohol dehydrogenase family) [Sulfitobacter mediterraneus]